MLAKAIVNPLFLILPVKNLFILLLSALAISSAQAQTTATDSVKIKKHRIGVRFAGNFNYYSNSFNAKLFEFHKEDFRGSIAMPSLVFGSGLVDRGTENRHGAIFEVALPSFRQSFSGGNTNSNVFVPQQNTYRTWNLNFYGAYKQLLPLPGFCKNGKWQPFVGASVRYGFGSTKNTTFTQDIADNTNTIQYTSNGNYVEINPLVGMQYAPHPRILIDLTFTRFLGNSLINYIHSTSDQVTSNSGGRFETTNETKTFQSIGDSRLQILSDTQVGMSFLF